MLLGNLYKDRCMDEYVLAVRDCIDGSNRLTKTFIFKLALGGGVIAVALLEGGRLDSSAATWAVVLVLGLASFLEKETPRATLAPVRIRKTPASRHFTSFCFHHTGTFSCLVAESSPQCSQKEGGLTCQPRLGLSFQFWERRPSLKRKLQEPL